MTLSFVPGLPFGDCPPARHLRELLQLWDIDVVHTAGLATPVVWAPRRRTLLIDSDVSSLRRYHNRVSAGWAAQAWGRRWVPEFVPVDPRDPIRDLIDDDDNLLAYRTNVPSAVRG